MKKLIAIALLAAACASKPAPTDGEILAKIAEEYWQHQLDQDVSLQAKLGLPIKHLPDASYLQAQHESSFGEQILRRLDEINIGHLSDDDRITYSLLRWDARKPVDSLRFFWLRSPVTPYASPIRVVNQTLSSQKLESSERVRLLGEYARFVDQITEVVKVQRQRGYVLPKPEQPIVRGVLSSYLQPPDKSALRGGDDTPAVRDALSRLPARPARRECRGRSRRCRAPSAPERD